MMLDELRRWLEVRDIPEGRRYCLSGGLPNEAMCVDREKDGRWSVYFSERGGRTGLRIFDTEDEACEYFIEYVEKYWIK